MEWLETHHTSENVITALKKLNPEIARKIPVKIWVIKQRPGILQTNYFDCCYNVYTGIFRNRRRRG
jgi:hypothetical protein